MNKIALRLIKLAREVIAADHKIVKELKLRSGTVIPVGMHCKVEWKNKDASVAIVTIDDDEVQPIKIHTSSLYKYISGFHKTPSMNTLEKWSSDGVAKSVTGQRVEPDGWGVDGAPSWLLAIGVI
jgi:hypothetical protein